MIRLLPILLLAGPLLAQTSTSSYSQTVHLIRREQQVETHLTRIISRVSGGPNLYDQTFNLPTGAPEVQAAFAQARALVKGTPALAFQDAVNSLTDVNTRVVTEQTNAIQTIGRTRRETMGPATVMIGALATGRSPCTGYSGGLPVVNGGLSPDDGFLFKFTTPLTPIGCPLEGTPFAVAAGTLHVDTLIHIHTDLYQTSTTIRTTATTSTYEIVGTPSSPLTSGAAPEVPSILVRYIRNLDRGDSVINMTNSGARGAGLAAGTTAATTGAICVNAYTFSADDEMVGCCSCPVTPNGLVTLSARRDFVNFPRSLTKPPTSLVVKLYATVPARSLCIGSAYDGAVLAAPGLHAWGTSIQIGAEGKPDPVTVSPFLVATLGPGERERLVSRCAMVLANGSGFGICSTCRLGSVSFLPR